MRKDKNKFTLGLDVGGTTTKIGLISCDSLSFKVVEYIEIPTICGKENISDMFDSIKKEVDKMRKGRFISCCCIGMAGLVNPKEGIVVYAPNVLWSGVNLKEIAQNKLKMPTIVENDANVAVVGIYHKVVKPKHPEIKDIVCFTLGTGIGGGVILQGHLLRGNFVTAAEIGHIVIDINGKKCGCGSWGCLERFVGARWFIDEIKEILIKEKPSTILYKLLNNDISKLTPKVLYDAAINKDEFALNQWKRYGEYLGIAVSNIVNIVNPQMIIFTGGVSKASKFFLPFIKQKVKDTLWPAASFSKYAPSKNIKYLVVSDKKIYGVLGAGILAYESFLAK